MTLEELKKYREKCVEVQRTIKRDCEYLQSAIDHKENCKLRNFEDFVRKVMGLYQYLPTVEERKELYCGWGKTVSVKDREVYVSFGGSLYNPNWWGFSICWIYNFDHRGIHICSNGFGGWKDMYNDDTRKEFQMWVGDNAEELYGLLVNVVANVNKAYNNALIEKNKELLDKAEALHN